jgi:hypothetical protein
LIMYPFLGFEQRRLTVAVVATPHSLPPHDGADNRIQR